MQPSAAQVERYAAAMLAYREQRLEEAEVLLRAVLQEGGFNLFHLSLGRVLALRGDCQGAAAELAQVERARPVLDPSPDAVQARAQDFRRELDLSCPGVLSLECAEGVRVSVDGQPELRCPLAPMNLPPGEHFVIWRQEGQEARRELVVLALEELRVSLPSLSAPKPPPEVVAPPPVVVAPVVASDGLAIAGGAVTGAGAGLMVMALWMDLVWVPEREEAAAAALRRGDAGALDERADEARLWSGVSYGVAGVTLLGGVGLWLWSWWADDPAPAGGASLWFSPDGQAAGALWRW